MNYTELQTKIAAWVHRTDLSAVIPDFITLAEEKINRHLRVRQMETTLAVTPITANLITPASDIVDVKTLWHDNLPGTPLKQQSLESVVSAKTDGLASLYAWKGADIYFNGVGDVTGVLYQRIPALATATNNWLSDGHPGVYLFGAMVEAVQYIQGDATAWLQRFETAINEVQSDDRRMPGPLVARAR